MSQTFSIVCDETKQKLWIGQGHGHKMTCLYSGEKETMENIRKFLDSTMGKPLRMVVDADLDDYAEFGEST